MSSVTDLRVGVMISLILSKDLVYRAFTDKVIESLIPLRVIIGSGSESSELSDD